jgi:hypothetical protein
VITINIISKIKYKLSNIISKPNLNFLEVGDIIWAKRYSSEKERISIEVGHQQGPYIIIHKDEKKNKVYGLYCTSSKNKDTNKLHYVILDKVQYKLKLFKTTYIHTTSDSEIKYNQYIKKIGHLTDKDLNRLFKIITILKKEEPDKISTNINLDELQYTIEVGDIINNKGTKYFVYDIDDTYYYGYYTNEITNARNYKNNKHSISFNGKRFTISYENKSKILKSNNVTLEYIIDKSQFPEIEEQKKELIKKLEESSIVKRGSLVKYNNIIYIVYGEYKDNWQTYKVYNTKDDESFPITINQSNYFTKFEELLINKSENMKTIKNASDDELDKIKYTRKSIKVFNNKQYVPQSNNKTSNKSSIKNSFELSKQQEILLLKLKSFNFKENEIVAIMIRLNQKYQIEELLDYIYTQEKENKVLTQDIITKKILNIK